jgi:mediator of RNA polymerase II transcription subunit 14
LIPTYKVKIESQNPPGAGLEGLAEESGAGVRQAGDLEKASMPGVIMEDGSRNGPHTNHDRETVVNGTNGAVAASDPTHDRGKSRGETQPSIKQSQIANGANGALSDVATQSQSSVVEAISQDDAEQIQQLPPEIVHITEGFEPLSKLLMRLAQVTNNRLSTKIMELAAMPTATSAVNGNGMHYPNGSDDNSVDNVKKKVNLLKFAEQTHADWTKALVITHWSRISEDVSKVIDLRVHLNNQRIFYDAAVFELSEVKRSLVHARVPNPDLKTAVEVLSTGKASWMPDVCVYPLCYWRTTDLA